jgi:hypothetical protein
MTTDTEALVRRAYYLGRGSTCLTWSTSGPSVAHLRENIAGAALTLPADAAR